VKYRSSYRVVFDAGHRYTVDITWDREGLTEADLTQFDAAVELTRALRFELANRSLEKMLGPHHPSPYGIASFFLERLKLNLPVTEVRVHESDSDVVAIIEDDSVF